ncbi:hypothetical protein HYT23_00880 [Candidatus Pacearchaeota archaeon]|nr:hypothetical protein [Candidatus Pacearchaeota archaeon]
MKLEYALVWARGNKMQVFNLGNERYSLLNNSGKVLGEIYLIEETKDEYFLQLGLDL